MSKNKLPLYAIVELLMRLAGIDPQIGNYKNHSERGDNVLVKTANGTIQLSRALVLSQFHKPEDIEKRDLESLASRFRRKLSRANR
ncbi:hypothetical protein DIU31_023460 [Mucilaginibacter rubeus]|uniref:Uncharacterized protein n=1 Tax=Mucilaginibacter rubeus TaxID=2027860 RepID=A0AAE6MKC3_9SPHI|nr:MULTISPECIES: hypothetical protein [Mucilaginibacter]QEM06334.1 hypothetical protein DIU31_023460 [Mucilaginibacter rubeus]QEM18915.1 hypothetical protein DIU38_023695 [Mucilaginibacter gossypii]QTE44542.1 hypothetical protein J3L19_04020 [Mucilaginibacter rubeus]QTE51140.1 hypothetical protein J3L21_03995 [Mucilaginibacter rubeus]QTE56226.1 hypothetical protein J3L23_29245 [Mucilaginibacter rubeus]